MEKLARAGEIVFGSFGGFEIDVIQAPAEFYTRRQFSNRAKRDTDVIPIPSRHPNRVTLSDVGWNGNRGLSHLASKLELFLRRETPQDSIESYGHIHGNVPRVEVTEALDLLHGSFCFLHPAQG